MQSISVRIDVTTHKELKRLAAVLGTSMGNTVTLAVRSLRQDHIGNELQAPLTEDETAWLDATQRHPNRPSHIEVEGF